MPDSADEMTHPQQREFLSTPAFFCYTEAYPGTHYTLTECWLTLSVQGPSLESDVYRRQILTAKDDPALKELNIYNARRPITYVIK